MLDDSRVGIVAYGSLLAPDALDDLFDGLSDRITPVTVSGFQRRFDQAASWRETDGRQCAVLNVAPDGDHWFNGLFVGDITPDELRRYRQRERGYRIVEVTAEELEPYSHAAATGPVATLDDAALTDHDLVLTTVGTKTDSEILPVDSYVDRCLSGAARWGEQFQRAFRSTTMVNTGETLADYLAPDETSGRQD